MGFESSKGKSCAALKGADGCRSFHTRLAEGQEVLASIFSVTDALRDLSVLRRIGFVDGVGSPALSKLTLASPFVEGENSLADELLRSVLAVLGCRIKSVLLCIFSYPWETR